MKTCITITIAMVSILLNHAGAQNWTEDKSGNVVVIKNKGGQTLGYSSSSGIKILTVDGFAFKDLNKNSKLDKYEDWRLSWDERAKDLARQMSVEQIAGLMLYSRHQSIPAASRGFMAATYGGKPFSESNFCSA